MRNRHVIAIIMVAVMVWGGVLAVGAYLGGGRLVPDFRRGMIVLAAPLAFLGIWLVLLFRRGRNSAEEDDTQNL